MTDVSAHGQESIDRWLADRHHHLCEGLARFLDPDAGLRESMLHDKHADLLGILDSKLDTEAGLAAILPPSAAAAPQPPPGPQQREPGLLEVAAAIAATDPAIRMALRRDPVILVVILSGLRGQLEMIVDTAMSGSWTSASHLALKLHRDLDRAFNLARDLDLARDRTLARDLRRVVDRAHALARNSSPGRLRVATLATALDRELSSANAYALALIDASDRTLYLDFTNDRSGASGDAANDVARVVCRALGVQHVEWLAEALLDGVLDDFTQVDLSHTDLTGFNLTGVRWSVSGTGWPPGTDVDALRARSREVAPGTGIYVITSPGDGNKTYHHAPA